MYCLSSKITLEIHFRNGKNLRQFFILFKSCLTYDRWATYDDTQSRIVMNQASTKLLDHLKQNDFFPPWSPCNSWLFFSENFADGNDVSTPGLQGMGRSINIDSELPCFMLYNDSLINIVNSLFISCYLRSVLFWIHL